MEHQHVPAWKCLPEHHRYSHGDTNIRREPGSSLITHQRLPTQELIILMLNPVQGNAIDKVQQTPCFVFKTIRPTQNNTQKHQENQASASFFERCLVASVLSLASWRLLPPNADTVLSGGHLGSRVKLNYMAKHCQELPFKSSPWRHNDENFMVSDGVGWTYPKSHFTSPWKLRQNIYWQNCSASLEWATITPGQIIGSHFPLPDILGQFRITTGQYCPTHGVYYAELDNTNGSFITTTGGKVATTTGIVSRPSRFRCHGYCGVIYRC